MRVREGEGIVDEISTGDQGAFACMLGGDDGRTLFICAAPGFAEADRIGATDAQLLAVRVDVPHGGLPVILCRPPAASLSSDNRCSLAAGGLARACAAFVTLMPSLRELSLLASHGG